MRSGGAEAARGVLLLSLLAVASAGPLGPLPNATSADVGFNEGSCAVGDVVYKAGDEFPGATPCDQCKCSAGGVACTKQRCEPRPGCKALHRPDHCCPTYQCECEQEGRVYGNGEKLLDPADPCRVCYCQGGEVVCRRIACFERDDCQPRRVPGRCCPEYDNCPLRGISGAVPTISSLLTTEDAGTSAAPPPKQEITIKEITPVSEIPVITEVKITEILPSSEVADYSSSKSPLNTREATSEKSDTTDKDLSTKTEGPTVVTEIKPSESPVIPPSSPVVEEKTEKENIFKATTSDSHPSKISLATQDSINSDIYPSDVPDVATKGVIPVSSDAATTESTTTTTTSTTKAPIIEEEEVNDHNPAFPPIPDDLSVLRNHEDEIVPEPSPDSEHHDLQPAATTTAAPQTTTVKEVLTTTVKEISSEVSITTEKAVTQDEVVALVNTKTNTASSTETSINENSLPNLRSAITTEILSAPSALPLDIIGDQEDLLESTTILNTEQPVPQSKATTEVDIKLEGTNVEKPSGRSEVAGEDIESTTFVPTENTKILSTSSKIQEKTTIDSIAKSSIATEDSSLLYETTVSTHSANNAEQSDATERTSTEMPSVSSTTEGLRIVEVTSTKAPTSIEEITTKEAPLSVDSRPVETYETTEFFPLGSSESATVLSEDAVEIIKVPLSTPIEKSAAIIESGSKNSNVLKDLISLVGDVASISEHAEVTGVPRSAASSAATGIPESEELIPVNAGYKSKNKNFNQNSITEIPIKSKGPTPVNKQKVELEDAESESITDAPPPHDRVEPTTRRPIIDHLTADQALNKTERKDIEIITQSYVPSISRRPTKQIMQKTNDKLLTEELTTGEPSVSGAVESGSSSTPAETTVSTTPLLVLAPKGTETTTAPEPTSAATAVPGVTQTPTAVTQAADPNAQ